MDRMEGHLMRWRSNTQAEYEAAEQELAARADDFLIAADAHCNDPGDPNLCPHEWASYTRMHDTHRLYVEAATHLSRLDPH
jgi:hypothetical protein